MPFANGMPVTHLGQLYVVRDDIIHCYLGGLPRDVNGAVVLTENISTPGEGWVGGVRIPPAGVAFEGLVPPLTLGERDGVGPDIPVESRAAYPEFTGTITVTSPQGLLSKNDDGTWGTSVTLVPGDFYRAIVTSSTEYLTDVVVIVDLPDTFTVTTRAQDITPDTFILTPVGGADPNTSYESNPPTITGIDPDCPISIVDGEYEINQSDVWTSDPGTIDPSSAVAVRRDSGGYGEIVSAALTIGTVTRNFVIGTMDDPNIGESAVKSDGTPMVKSDGTQANRSDQ